MEMNRALLVAGVMLAVIIGVPLLLGAFGVSRYDTGSAIGNSLLWVIENPYLLGGSVDRQMSLDVRQRTGRL